MRPALGIGLLALVVVVVNPGEVLSRLATARLGLVVPAVIGLTAMHAIAAAGWRAILARVAGVRLSWSTSLSLYYAAQAIGGVTPANLGGDIHRVASLRDSGWKASVMPVVIQRATSYLSLSLLSLAGLGFLAAQMEVAIGMVALGVAFAGAVAIVAWFLLFPPTRMHRLHARLLGLIGGANDGAEVRFTGVGSSIALGFGQGLAFHAGSIGLTCLLVLAVDPGAPALPVLGALAVARLATAVPFVPSGLGVQEGALGFLFLGLGLPVDTAVAAMLLARLSLLLTTAVGAFLIMRNAGRPDDARAAVRSIAPRT